jgi:hypothetical protein
MYKNIIHANYVALKLCTKALYMQILLILSHREEVVDVNELGFEVIRAYMRESNV